MNKNAFDILREINETHKGGNSPMMSAVLELLERVEKLEGKGQGPMIPTTAEHFSADARALDELNYLKSHAKLDAELAKRAEKEARTIELPDDVWNAFRSQCQLYYHASKEDGSVRLLSLDGRELSVGDLIERIDIGSVTFVCAKKAITGDTFAIGAHNCTSSFNPDDVFFSLKTFEKKRHT